MLFLLGRSAARRRKAGETTEPWLFGSRGDAGVTKILQEAWGVLYSEPSKVRRPTEGEFAVGPLAIWQWTSWEGRFR